MLDLENTITVRQVGTTGTTSPGAPSHFYPANISDLYDQGPPGTRERERGDRTSLMNGTTLLGFTQI